ncbi:C-C motif chemokine 20a.3 [Salvelinus alpinus]|uniref:C-C motif chemokine 20a.3 n=1 Tax=Salvelinus alpinus TaxID=8036 RepID=UPI0039FCEEF0
MAQMRAPVIVLLVLLALGLFATETSAAKRPRRRRGCCESYTLRKTPFAVIEGYTLQTISETCRIFAIRFHTEKGKDVCADPDKNWVKEHVSRLGTKAAHIKTSQAKSNNVITTIRGGLRI